MKPLRVRMQAFGPYAAEQLLDFADLGANRFFLITGPTGSGKTSVLDAMAYALYGETTSGAEKDGGRAGADMRSHHAPADLLTEVEFDFAVGTDTYRVLRRPAQERPRKRGEGTAIEPQQAELWRLRPGESDRAGGRDVPLASGWAAVSKQTEDILGFRAEQFRQVVMLPQGRFQELLRSDSRTREDILAMLFDTGFYERIEVALKEKAADIGRRYRALEQRRSVVFEQIGVADVAGLADELAAAQTAAGAAAAAATAGADVLADAQRALHEAQAVADQLAAAQREEQAVQELLRRADSVEQQRHQLQAARRAALVADAAEAVRLRDAERAEQELRLLAAEQALDIAVAAKERSARQLDAEQARAPRREQTSDEVRKLRALEAVVSGLAELRQQSAAAARACRAAADTHAQAERAAADAAHAAAEAQAAFDAAERRASGKAALDLVAAEARLCAERRGELELAGGRFGGVHESVATALGAADQAEREYQAAVAELDALELAWARGQAGVLAGGLRAGQPCPVCGSTEHPAPAPVADAPTEQVVAGARSVRDKRLAARDTASRAALEAEHTADALAQSVEQLAKTLGDAATLSTRECEAAAEAAATELAAAARAVAAVPRLRDDLQAARQTGERAAAARDQAAAAAADATAAERSLQATLDERAAGVPASCQEPAALEAALAAAERRRDELEASLEAARVAAQQAEIGHTGAAADLKAVQRALDTAKQAASAAAATLAARLAEQGFADEDAWREACCPSDDVDELDEVVSGYDADLTAAKARRDQAMETARELTPPDLPAAQQAVAAARARADQTAAAKAELDARFRMLCAAREQVRQIDASSTELQRDYEVVGRVADVVTGSNPLRLNFQRFVLGAFLDRVLEVASRRLRLMSGDRYELQRTESSRGHGRAAGLELVVFDAWTGYARPVGTLSGGETFLAALALALGLADVVQSYSGGIRLDTVFVDEGFGSLDDEALDLAIDALVALQDGGRLVGIISHVAELRERIDARLEIIAGKTGSVARFVVP